MLIELEHSSSSSHFLTFNRIGSIVLAIGSFDKMMELGTGEMRSDEHIQVLTWGSPRLSVQATNHKAL